MSLVPYKIALVKQKYYFNQKSMKVLHYDWKF